MTNQLVSVVCNYNGRITIDQNGVRSADEDNFLTHWKDNVFYIDVDKKTTISHPVGKTVISGGITFGSNSSLFGNTYIKGNGTINGVKYTTGCYRNDKTSNQKLNELWINTERVNVKLSELRLENSCDVTVLIPVASNFKLDMCKGSVFFGKTPIVNCEFTAVLSGGEMVVDRRIINSNLNFEILKGKIYLHRKCEQCNLDVKICESGGIYGDVDSDTNFEKIVATVLKNGSLVSLAVLNELKIVTKNAKCVKLYCSKKCVVDTEGTADKFVIHDFDSL